MSRPRLEVEIGELVLHGFPAGADPEAIAAAVRAELATLLGSGSLPAGWSSGGSVTPQRGIDVAMPRGAGAEAMGVEIARGIHAGVGGDARHGR